MRLKNDDGKVPTAWGSRQWEGRTKIIILGKVGNGHQDSRCSLGEGPKKLNRNQGRKLSKRKKKMSSEEGNRNANKGQLKKKIEKRHLLKQQKKEREMGRRGAKGQGGGESWEFPVTRPAKKKESNIRGGGGAQGAGVPVGGNAGKGKKGSRGVGKTRAPMKTRLRSGSKQSEKDFWEKRGFERGKV